MGNTSTKEARSGDSGQRGQPSGLISGADPAHSSERSSNRRNRVSRGDLGGILGLGSPAGSSSRTEPPYERRETRQEREARRLERERVARVAERERSMKEEHVDGGFLVTLGTYTGPEDFNKQIVRQLQVSCSLLRRAGCTVFLTSVSGRLSERSPRSGEASTISTINGQSHKSSPPLAASPSPRQTRLLPTT